MDYKALEKKVRDKSVNICVIGLGYVGLPLALAFARSGFDVTGFDISEKKINSLKLGTDPSREASKRDIEKVGNKIEFTNDEKSIGKAGVIIVCVPTPIDEKKKPDLRCIEGATKTIGKNLKRDTIVVFESTVYPGLTENVLGKIIEKESGLKLGAGFSLGYSPERMNPGDSQHTLDKIVKVVSGYDHATLDILAELYGNVAKNGIFRAKGIKVAEGAKVIENIQRDLNIAIVNELALIFERLGIDVYDVLEAAGTKWNFHKYSPGLVGGHCLDKKHFIFVENDNNLKTETLEDYFKKISEKYGTGNINGTKIASSENARILTFDLDKKVPLLKKLKCISERHDKVLEIVTDMNQRIKVSEKHPMIICEDHEFYVKHACNLKINDKIPVSLKLPQKKLEDIDIINHLNKKMIEKIRVKPINKNFRDYKKTLQIKKNCGEKASNFYHLNYLPLKFYLKLEKIGLMPIKRDDICLTTGRGPSTTMIRAIFKINKSFMRIIGYYLSEGCVTKDNSLRVRWVFNEDEKEYLEDLRNCLRDLCVKFSEHSRKLDKGYCVKVSSEIFGFMIEDILKCGTNSYNMKLPDNFLFAKDELKIEILKGLFRGDGSVSYENGKMTYKKGEKTYTHNTNSACIEFFSISPRLLQQVILMLLHFKIIPTFSKRRPLLRIFGHKNLEKMIDFFDGKEREKLESYFKNKKKFIKSKYKRHGNLLTVSVKSIKECGEDLLYSVETEGTNTFITDYGIIVHNCIPVDPYYLVHAARNVGYEPRVILAGRDVNNYMPHDVVNKVVAGMKKKGKSVKGGKVLVLGLTFKKNVSDVRMSPSKVIIDGLKEKGCDVLVYDPLVDKEYAEKRLEIRLLDNLNVNDFGCIVLATDHDAFKELSLEKLKSVSDSKPVLVDARHFYDKDVARKLGFLYMNL